MTEKKKALIEALCDEYEIDYPELGDNGDDEDTRTTDELYQDKLRSCAFESGCYNNHEWMSLAKFVRIAENIGLLDDDF